MAAMSVAERRKETRSIAPNCRHPRFVFKTKDVCTRTPHGIVCFHTVKDYDALIEAFQPRMLVDGQIRAAPDGIYCWILRETEGVPHVYAMKVICEQEIGSLHNFIFLLSSKPGILLTEDEKFIDAHEVIAAGELVVSGENREFNLQSGSFMEPIFRMTGWQPIIGRRIPKTDEMLLEEIKEKEKEVATLAARVAPYLSPDKLATFAYMKPPTPARSLNRTIIVEHVKSVSEALGGRPFIKGAKIMVSENNMGFLRSLLSTDPPVWKANRPYEQSKKRKDPGPNAGPNAGPKAGQKARPHAGPKARPHAGPHAGRKTKKATASHPPQQSHPPQSPTPGGARRTRKHHKKHTYRR